MVLGDDSCSIGHGFESRCHILDGHFSNCIVCLRTPKINEKEAGVGPCFKNNQKFRLVPNKNTS